LQRNEILTNSLGGSLPGSLPQRGKMLFAKEKGRIAPAFLRLNL
jgi:hypothetical protein